MLPHDTLTTAVSGRTSPRAPQQERPGLFAPPNRR